MIGSCYNNAANNKGNSGNDIDNCGDNRNIKKGDNYAIVMLIVIIMIKMMNHRQNPSPHPPILHTIEIGGDY